MKLKYLKLKNWLLVTVMGAFGLSSCHCHKELATPEEEPVPSVKEPEPMRLMYGVPTMNFMIRGQVKDVDGRPVKDIRVNMLEPGMEVKDGELQGDARRVELFLRQTSVTTDSRGRFELSNTGRPMQEVRLLVRDVDGEKNGEFKNQLLELAVEQGDVNREGAGGWNQGTYNKELEIKLENR